ncbi:MAG TPA: farnesyl diphosphate synthase, partial [Nitrospiria bacterium]
MTKIAGTAGRPGKDIQSENALQAYLEDRRRRVDEMLDALLPAGSAEPPGLHEAMRYSVFAGGKRVRPILAIGAFEALGGDPGAILPVASAIEMVHTYSLIHDDLPAMDDDDLRRGRPTSHKKFGEAAAILAGDALLTAAFGVIADPGAVKGFPPGSLMKVVLELAESAGSRGMVGGQFVDIRSEGESETSGDAEARVRYIHTHKTGCLIRGSVRIGALLGGAPPGELSAFNRYGENLGLAFQVVDDILDVEGSAEETGKAVGKDGDRDKMTYPEIFGLEESKQVAARLR